MKLTEAWARDLLWRNRHRGLSRALLVVAVLGFAACTGLPRVAAGDEVRIGYISRAVDHPPALSNLDEPLTNEGVQGARLGIDDNNSTGRFTKQSFTPEEKMLAVGGDVVAAAISAPA